MIKYKRLSSRRLCQSIDRLPIFIMAFLPFSICLYATCISNWRDPPVEVSFNVTTNLTNPVRIGDVVQFNCTSINHREESTLEWMRLLGNTETRAEAGRSTLVHTRTITAEDHGTEFYCGSWWTVVLDEGSWTTTSFYAKSEKFTIEVEGVTAVQATPNWDNTRTWVNVNPDESSYNVGDEVEYVCDAENLGSGYFVEMRQVKRNLETKLYTGYHLGYRWLAQTLAASDDDTYIYCRIYTSNWAWTYFDLIGPAKQIRVNH